MSAKTIMVPRKVLSANLQKRISKFGPYNSDLKRYLISAPLIAQLSKNYSDNLNNLITGNELLKIACNKVSEAHGIIGGRVVYLECEDKEQLIEFYKRNGFAEFGERTLDLDEVDFFSSKHLIQMLKYLS